MDYKDISVDQYLNIRATIKEHEGSELDLHVKLISLIFDMSEDEVLDLPLPKFEELNKELSFLYKQPKITGKIPNTIVLNGRKYTVVKDAKKLTASQYIDYNSYCDLPDPDTHIAQVLSVFLIPDGEKYGSYEIEPVIDEISNYLSAQLAFDVCFFFSKEVTALNKEYANLFWSDDEDDEKKGEEESEVEGTDGGTSKETDNDGDSFTKK